MGKTRKFIDKKTANRFSLVNRSQTDELRGSEDHSDLVLKPILRPNEEMPTDLGLDPSVVDFSRPSDSSIPPFVAAARAAYRASQGFDDDDEVPDLFEEDDEDYGAEYQESDEDEEQPVEHAGVYRKGELVGQSRVAASQSDAAKASEAARAKAVKKKRAGLVFDRWGSGGMSNFGLTQEEVDRLPHDYDYSKHMRTRGGGSYFKAVGDEAPNIDKYVEMQPPKEIDESDLDAKYGGKTLPSFDPEEVAKIVKPRVRVTREFYRAFDIEDDAELAANYQELDDDFVAKCMQDGGLTDADENEEFDDDELFGDDAFDDEDDEGFEELVKSQQTKAQPRKVKFGDADSDEVEDDDEDWDDDEQEGRAKPGRALTKSERKAEQALQDALDEYSDEEIGDLEDDPDARGQVEDVMEEFSDFIDKCLEPKKHDYDGPDLLVRPEISQAEAAEMTRKAIENLALNDRDDPAAEAASMAAFEASLARQPEPEFDCQSIVSTYSNLENRPRVIAVPKAGKIIKLHPVTGVPMGVAVKKRQTTIVEEDESNSDSDDSSYDDATSVVTVNKGQSRSKKETKEEKAARKAAAKDAKRQNRQRKKELRTAFKNEEKALNASVAQQRRDNPQGVRI